jgi:hypothetical protein
MTEHLDNQLDASLLKMVGNVAALKIDIMSQIIKASSKRRLQILS